MERRANSATTILLAAFVVITAVILGYIIIGSGLPSAAFAEQMAPELSQQLTPAMQEQEQQQSNFSQLEIVEPKQFVTTELTGSEEGPTVQTIAGGQGLFLLHNISTSGNASHGEILEFRIVSWNINNITAANIHSGKAFQNGEVVSTLYSAEPSGGLYNLIMLAGNITATDLEGPLKGKPLSELVALMDDGGAYVNILTEANPNGEIRGQILLASSSIPLATNAGMNTTVNKQQ